MPDDAAYAIPAIESNFCLILSECGGKQTKGQIEAKIPAYEGGFFVRDPKAKWDCQFFTSEAFYTMYKFRFDYDEKTPLQEIVRI